MLHEAFCVVASEYIIYYYITTAGRMDRWMDGHRHRFGAQGQWFPLSPRRQSIKDDNKPREDVGGQLVSWRLGIVS